MIAVLFQGSFKKQLKFNQFLFQQKESTISITLEPVPPEEWQQSFFSIIQVPNVLGEDPFSIEAHVKVLHSQYEKVQPDTKIVKDRMQQTFAWRRKEIADGMTLAETLEKYPFLRTSRGLCDEVQRIHPAMENMQQRFSEGFACIMPKVLHLTQGKSPLYQLYQQARKEALTEDVPDIDRQAALFFLPYIFRENTDLFIMLGESVILHPHNQQFT
ncbi:uncharacterized protein LOC124876465 isoform X3 [Girardinichthys multiradiatus]|uniref:uncharacterized protein LOC124876465 isoform X3 n=1 Tax=Girardinichthys multiradiatus TaxID=208333 RepID=UPI001FACF5BF|nr:uncharacterized protein LOC124876465 isoform X3 [Girardinichthys multiradiatus]